MFNKLKLNAKITMLAGILLVISVILGTFAIISMFSAAKKSAQIAEQAFPAIHIMSKILSEKGDLRTNLRDFTLSSNMNMAKAADEVFVLIEKEFSDMDELLETADDLPIIVATLPKIKPLEKNLKGLSDSIFPLAEEQLELKKKLVPLGNKILQDIIDLRIELTADRDRGGNGSSTKDRDNMFSLLGTTSLVIISFNTVTLTHDTTGYANTVATAGEVVGYLLSLMNSTTLSPKYIAMLNDIFEETKEYDGYFDRYVKIQIIRDDIYHKQLESMTAFNHDIDTLIEQVINRNSQKAKIAESSLHLGSIVSLILLFFAIALGTVSSILIARSIIKPISESITDLSSGSNQVTAAAGEISKASQSMASGASEQASSLQEISSSLNEIASMTRQTADNARNADALVQDSVQKTKASREAMERLQNAVVEIQHSSNETSKILKDIDEIAFQTNLLALNAAVEAARAGEAGKGFAVVAEEVRNLAQRSAQSAKKTSVLVEGSQKSCSHGVSLAEETAQAIEKITETSEKIAAIVTEITSATEEQSHGISQVSSAITNMDTVTQANASQSEELAASSEELNSQALSMDDSVGALVGVVDGEDAKFARERQNQIAASNRFKKPVGKKTAATKTAAIPEKSQSARPAKQVHVIPFDDDNKDFGNY